MIFRLSFLLIFFNLSLAFSQDQLWIDSIQKLILDYDAKKGNPDLSVPGDTIKIEWLMDLAGQHLNLNPDKAFFFAQEAESISRQLNDTFRISNCYNIYGCCNINTSEIDSAISCFNKELELLNYLEHGGDTTKIISKYIFGAITNLATAYARKGDLVKTLQYIMAGVKLNEVHRDTFSLAFSYMNIAWVYKSIENYDKSTMYYEKALRLFHLLYNEIQISSCLLGLGSIEQALGHNNTAEAYYKSVIDWNPEYGIGFYQQALIGMAEISITRGEALEALKYNQLELKSYPKSEGSGYVSGALLGIGETYVALGKLDSAILYFTQAIDIARKFEFKNTLSSSLINLGGVYHKMGNYVNARKYIREGLEFAKDIKDLDLIKSAYQELIPVYVATNDFKRAYEYNVLLKEVNDSIFSLANANKITQLSMQYEIDQSEQAYQGELDRKDAEQRAELSQQKQQKKFYIAGGIFLFLLTGGLVNRLVYSSKTKRLLEEKNTQIEKEKLRAEQSERFKQQFLANMSHEIRTPMNAVMGMTHLLMVKDPRKDQYPYLDGMKKSSDNLLHIINDILDLAKIEAGKMDLENIDFSLSDVIGQIEQILKHEALEKGLQWIVELDPNIPVLLGDPVRLFQVLMNLAGNAIKFTDKGSVHIAVRNNSPEMATDLIPIQFSVIDTGIGIARDKLDLVLDEFQQANTSDSRKYGGTGLGLNISKQLIELLGGKISIESEEFSGTTFSFLLHFQEGSKERLQQRNNPEAEVNGSILNGLKILVADDNAYNLIVAGDTLKLNAEVSIRTATTGKEVVALLQENEFDVILMDVQMPEWNGFEATQYIRSHFASPKKDIPIIAFTASVLRTDLDKCRQAGMNSYIAKPFTASQLINGIAEVLNK